MRTPNLHSYLHTFFSFSPQLPNNISGFVDSEPCQIVYVAFPPLYSGHSCLFPFSVCTPKSRNFYLYGSTQPVPACSTTVPIFNTSQQVFQIEYNVCRALKGDTWQDDCCHYLPKPEQCHHIKTYVRSTR